MVYLSQNNKLKKKKKRPIKDNQAWAWWEGVTDTREPGREPVILRVAGREAAVKGFREG